MAKKSKKSWVGYTPFKVYKNKKRGHGQARAYQDKKGYFYTKGRKKIYF